MRAFFAGVPLLVLLVAACSAPADDPLTGATGATTEGLSHRGASCSISRSQMLSAASPARRRAIQRGLAWLDAHVPYSQSGSHNGYRTDCSGFVSMCWELGTSTNTASMVGGSFNTRLGSYDQLAPADALLKNGHVSLFVGWNDAAHTSACLLEEGNSATGTQMRAAAVSSLKSQGFRPVRAEKLAGDTGATTGADEPDPTAPADPTDPTDPQQDPSVPLPPTRPDTSQPASSDPGDTSCWSRTLGNYVPELTCVFSSFDQTEEQCHEGQWYRGVSSGAGPFGACASEN